MCSNMGYYLRALRIPSGIRVWKLKKIDEAMYDTCDSQRAYTYEHNNKHTNIYIYIYIFIYIGIHICMYVCTYVMHVCVEVCLQPLGAHRLS